MTDAIESTETTPNDLKASADMSLTEVLKRNEALLSDNVKYREERKGLRKQIQTLDEQARQVSELQTQVETMKTAHRSELAMSKIEALAVSEGIIDPVVVKSLFEAADLKFDADGKLTNAAELVASFKTARPKLFTPVDHSASSVHEAPEPGESEVRKEFTVEELALKPSQLFGKG